MDYNYDLVLINIPYLTNNTEVLEPIGLTFLASYLESKGFKIKGFDFSYYNKTPSELCEEFDLYKYTRIGLSFYNTNALYAYELAKHIKNSNSNTLIIAGGAHVSAVDSNVFINHPEIDIVVRNEGELTTEELLNALNSKRSLEQVNGISYHIDGKIHSTPVAKRVDNLDELPTPTFKFEGNIHPNKHSYFDRISNKRKSAISMVSSRSCPYNCSFCAIILIGREWRKCSPSKVINDLIVMEKINNTKYEHIYFLDANFFVNVRRTLEVAERLNEYNKEISFSFSTRANQIVNAKKFMPKLVDLGLRAIEVGIESGNESALNRFGKDTKLEQNVEAIKILQENNIELFLDFIMFDPECTIEELETNLNFLAQLELDSLVPWDHLFNHMTPYLGTKIRERYENILGVKFEEDILPKIDELFIDNNVKDLYKEFIHFDSITNKLKQILTEFNKINNKLKFNKKNAILKLNIITIRRLPYVILQNMIKQVKFNEKPNYKKACPHFYDNFYNIISLDMFLDQTLTWIKLIQNEKK